MTDTKRKLTKAAAAYDEMPFDPHTSTGHNCRTCAMFDPNRGRCAVVKGSIRPQDTCNLWTLDGRSNMHWLSGKEAYARLEQHQRLHKTEGGYVCALPPKLRPKTDAELTNSVMCGNCFHLNHKARKDDPTQVDNVCFPIKGKISMFGCCNLYKRDGKETVSRKYADGATVAKMVGDRIADIEDLCS